MSTVRSTLDRLVSYAGLLAAVILLVAGGLLTWASSFIGDQVNTQLSEQHITMPTSQAYGSLPQADQDALAPYAGKAMTTGPMAKAYADHYILVHMNEAADSTYKALNMTSPGSAYADVPDRAVCGQDATSTACTSLQSLKATLFQGSTLRGLLLYGYAFATIGTIASYAAIGAYIGGVLMLILGILGFVHARRVEAQA